MAAGSRRPDDAAGRPTEPKHQFLLRDLNDSEAMGFQYLSGSKCTEKKDLPHKKNGVVSSAHNCGDELANLESQQYKS